MKTRLSMGQTTASSRFQEVIETVESLPPEDQEALVEVIRQRLIQRRRALLVTEVAEARNAYRRGKARRGTAFDLMNDIRK
jgi:hypothetical protein